MNLQERIDRVGDQSKRKIYLLCVEDAPVGFTEDADWAIKWENRLQGRSVRIVSEVVPAEGEP